MDTFINSEDPDEMLHYAAFHQGLYCLLGKKIFRQKKTLLLKTITCVPRYVQWPFQVYCIKPEGKIHLYTQ